MSKSIRVLHIGDEMNWRGGENQMRLLIEGSAGQDIQHHVAYPYGSRGLERFAELCPVIGFNKRKWWPVAIGHLLQFCRDNDIQIIDAQSSFGHGLALRLKRRLPELHVVVHRRVNKRIKPHWPTRRKYINDRIDRFVAISESIHNILCAYGIPAEKISLARSAIDTTIYAGIDREAARQALSYHSNIPDDSVLIGAASAFTHEKGHDVLTEALALLPPDSNFHVVLAGDGPLLDEMQALVVERGLQERVTFLGYQRDVPAILSALDILALPSNNEGLGSLLLDAGMAGCALVGSRVGGIPEIISDRETGLLFDVGNVQGLADCLEQLIRDATLRERLVTAAQKHIVQHFSLAGMVAGNLQVYRNMLQLNT